MGKKNSDVSKTVIGGSSVAAGGAILLKALKTKKITPKEEKEIIEIVKTSSKKPGEYIYRRAAENVARRKAARRSARYSAGSRGAGWLGSGTRSFSNTNNNMEIRRKVYSLLQDENGEERYYSTNEFELSYDEETGEKMFSSVGDKIKDTARQVGDAAGKGLVWMKTKTGEWVKVAKTSVKETAEKIAAGTKKAAGKVAEGAKDTAGKVAKGTKDAADKVVSGAKAAAGKDINFMVIHKPALLQYPKHTVNKIIRQVLIK